MTNELKLPIPLATGEVEMEVFTYSRLAPGVFQVTPKEPDSDVPKVVGGLPEILMPPSDTR